MNRLEKYLRPRTPIVPLVQLTPLGGGGQLYADYGGWNVLFWTGGRGEEEAVVGIVDAGRRRVLCRETLRPIDLQQWSHFAPIFRPRAAPPAAECDEGRC